MRIRVLPYQFRNPSDYRTRAVLYVHVFPNSPFKREWNFETARTLLRKHVWYVIMQLLVWRDSVPGDSKRKVQWMYACKNLEHICRMLYEATTPWVVCPCDGNFPQDFQIKDCLLTMFKSVVVRTSLIDMRPRWSNSQLNEHAWKSIDRCTTWGHI